LTIFLSSTTKPTNTMPTDHRANKQQTTPGKSLHSLSLFLSSFVFVFYKQLWAISFLLFFSYLIRFDVIFNTRR
jgi:hypothetical protein